MEKKLYLPKSFKLEEFKADIVEQCRIKRVDLTQNKLLNLLYNDPYLIFQEYQTYTNIFMNSISLHIDEKNFWKYFGNNLTDGFVPRVSSTKNYNISMSIDEKISISSENEND